MLPYSGFDGVFLFQARAAQRAAIQAELALSAREAAIKQQSQRRNGWTQEEVRVHMNNYVGVCVCDLFIFLHEWCICQGDTSIHTQGTNPRAALRA